MMPIKHGWSTFSHEEGECSTSFILMGVYKPLTVTVAEQHWMFGSIQIKEYTFGAFTAPSPFKFTHKQQLITWPFKTGCDADFHSNRIGAFAAIMPDLGARLWGDEKDTVSSKQSILAWLQSRWTGESHCLGKQSNMSWPRPQHAWLQYHIYHTRRRQRQKSVMKPIQNFKLC